MNRLQALLVVFLLWAALFLIGLGRTELKGEEGRRILPAITMLQSGEWLVPYVGGEPFLRKPPLVNWAIAGAFRLTGGQSEWAARLPSVLSVLGVASLIVLLSGRPGWLKTDAALVGAIVFLTQLATVEKGRLAEIEAIYFSLTGAAIVYWMAAWAQRRSPWELWLVPGAFLGLGLLAKGPPHLLFFYAVVLFVLWRAKERRLLLHPAHFAGLLLMGAIFAAWYLPYRHTEAGMRAAQVWADQSVGRLKGHFDFIGWITNIPRGLSNHLPWVLFAPLLWRRDSFLLGVREQALFQGARLAVALTFFGLLLIPGMLPRYALPLLAPFAILLAYALADDRLPPLAPALRAWWRTNSVLGFVVLIAACVAPGVYAWGRKHVLLHPNHFHGDYGSGFVSVLSSTALAAALALFVLVGRKKLARPVLIACSSGAVFSAGMLIYAAVGIPFITAADHLRPAAAQIDSLIPPGAHLILYDPEYQPVIFYLKDPYVYTIRMEEIPAAGAWVLTRAEKLKKLERDRPDLKIVSELGKPLELVLLRTPG